MESDYVANPSSTAATAHFNFWTTFSGTQPRAVFQTVWPCFPLTLPYEVTDPRPPLVANNYTGVVVPSQVMPCFYNNVRAIENPSKKEKRKFILDRFVFDLVDAHQYLALTDPTLLGWYLGLSPEDRKIIQDEGGFHQFLQRHPALELSSHHVYVKYDIGSTSRALPTMTSNKHTTSGAKTGRCAFNRPIIQDPNHQKAQNKHSSVSPLFQLNEDRPSWQMASSSAAVCKDPAALASFSVDMELEHNLSEWPAIEKESSSEYYSIQMDGREYGDRNIIQSVEQEQVSCLLDPAEENKTKEGCQDHMVYGPEYTVGDDEASLSFEEQSDNFHSIREDDDSILVCVACEDVKVCINRVHSDPVTTINEALAASHEALKSDQSVVQMNTAEKHTAPLPGVTTWEGMVGTELALGMSAFTQTEDPETSDKNIVTEVHMSDLDYVAKEFIKLKVAKKKQSEQKTKSAGCKLGKECDCIQRAEQAELSLLALQYSMCRQHCWRLYSISAEGGQLTQTPTNPPANIVSVLQKLESDYNRMKDKILAGVPLQHLKPLSVDSDKITTGTSYIPAQVIGDVLGNIPPRSSQEPQKHNASDDENGCPDNQSRNGCQRKEKEIKKENSKARRAVTHVPQDRDTIHNSHKQPQKQTKLDTSEMWYDAEEDLELAVAAETEQDPAVILKDKTNESASEEAKSSVLCVSNLPSNVTESDVMLWFEKYHASEVSISALKNDLRIAVVMISGPQSAEAAVRELNGCSMQGHTLHVEHINRAVGGSQCQASASISGPESSQDATKPQTSKPDSSSTGRKLITEQPLSSSMKKRTVVCTYLTAKGTSVPQRSGTRGSFGTLMAELAQQHPDVGRQRIVDALMELKAKHHGVLSGLPLRTIKEMTSELLTGPESATQS